ncbi:MAG: hypothetical protein ACLR71_12910 [[Clostridium] scindens]
MKRKKYWNKWVTGVILLLCSMFLCPDVRAEGNENLPDNPYVYAGSHQGGHPGLGCSRQ